MKNRHKAVKKTFNFPPTRPPCRIRKILVRWLFPSIPQEIHRYLNELTFALFEEAYTRGYRDLERIDLCIETILRASKMLLEINSELYQAEKQLDNDLEPPHFKYRLKKEAKND